MAKSCKGICQKCGRPIKKERYLVLLRKDLENPKRKGQYWCGDCAREGIWDQTVARVSIREVEMATYEEVERALRAALDRMDTAYARRIDSLPNSPRYDKEVDRLEARGMEAVAAVEKALMILKEWGEDQREATNAR